MGQARLTNRIMVMSMEIMKNMVITMETLITTIPTVDMSIIITIMIIITMTTMPRLISILPHMIMNMGVNLSSTSLYGLLSSSPLKAYALIASLYIIW